MNIKSYCRGIGAGMIITAIIMGVASNKRTITDSEVIRRAEELGYTQSSTLKQAETIDKEKEAVISSIPEAEADKKAEDETKISTATVKEEPKKVSTETSTTVSTSTSEKEEKVTETSTKTTEKTSTEKETQTSTSVSASAIDPMPEDEKGFEKKGEFVTIKVVRGDSSVSVSRRMYEAGLIESAVEFDQYLCSNGYDKSISVGEYEIEFGLDFEQMAKIITRRN